MITRNWQNIRQLPRFCIHVTHHLVRPGLYGEKLSMLEQSAACLPKLPWARETFHTLESWKAFVLSPKPYWIGISKPFT